MIRSLPPTTPTGAAFAAGGAGSELPPVVARFLEQLRRLPLGAWADAGRRLEELDRRDPRRRRGHAGDPDATASGEEVRRQLRELVAAQPRVAAQVRQRVLDLAAAAHGFVHPAEVSRMKKAALVAVLALVARPELGEERFARIYEPFADLIPLATLGPRAVPASAEPVDDADQPTPDA